MASFFGMMRDRRICEWIDRDACEQSGKIIELIMKQFERSYPGEEMLLVTLPKNNPEERRRTLETICKMLSE